MDLTVDHVVPRADEGATELSNLALACLACNARKWKFTVSPDSQTGRSVPLFNPRRQRWQDHFRWVEDDPTRIEGRTATGQPPDSHRTSHGRTPANEFSASRPDTPLAHGCRAAPAGSNGFVTGNTRSGNSLVLVLGRRVRRGGPKVAVGFHPSASAEPSRQTISSRRDAGTIATPSAAKGMRVVVSTDSLVAPRRTLRASSLPRGGWVKTLSDRQMSLRDRRHLALIRS